MSDGRYQDSADKTGPDAREIRQGADANAVYPLGQNAGETARLRQQADELAPDSEALLDRVGLRPGRSAADLGCGPRGILDLLARRVAPGGEVVGVDADPAHTAMATEYVRAQGLEGVRIVRADARRTGLPAASLDLVHARTLLINVPEPAAVVAEMVRLAKPDGMVAVAEPDTEHALCYPPHPAFDRISEIFRAAFTRHGADPAIGRRVPELFRQAGLTDVGVESRTQMYPPGNSRRTVRLDLVRGMRPQIVAMGLASERELDELDAAIRPHLEDPRTVAMSGLLFLVWGRKPS
jgi:ubiquinone/menaquinone biosynthesis C-methylase UbiE